MTGRGRDTAPRGRRRAGHDLEARLRSVRAPGEDAAANRALATVLAAHEAAPAVPRRRLRPALAVAVAVAVIAIVAAGLTSPGQAVGDWIRDVVHPQPKPKPAPAATVPPGRVLTAGSLGPYRDATWSPRGRFAAVTTPDALLAVAPGGAVRWRVRPPAPPRRPAWAPDGFRIAYLSGPQLRVVIGDGTDDRLFWGHARDVAPVFRPGRAHSVTWVDRDDRIRVADVDRARLEWSAPAPAGVHALAWSADGRRLLAAGRRRAVIYDLPGVRRNVRGRIAAVAFPPDGGPAALLERRGGGSSIRLLGSREPLIRTAGRYHGLQWAPDGRWLLTRWGRQWLYVRRDGRRVLTAQGRGTPLGWAR